MHEICRDSGVGDNVDVVKMKEAPMVELPGKVAPVAGSGRRKTSATEKRVENPSSQVVGQTEGRKEE